MTFSIIDAPQRSPEWHAARLGRLTGSRASDMLATIKTGEAAERRNLRVQLVLERLTGKSQDSTYTNADMAHGIETEPAAVAAYERITGRLVGGTGFLQADGLMAGCSLDGHINDFEGIIEIKCPKSATHLETLKTRKVPTKYLKQITHNLWISGAQWADFLSFDPRFPEPMQVVLIRIERHDELLAHYDIEARSFLSGVDAETESLRGMAVAS